MEERQDITIKLTSATPEILLPDRFTAVEFIGSGGMASVYKARDKELDQEVAVKVVTEGMTAEQLQRFTREAKLLSQLNHDNIVRFRSFGVTENGHPFQVMELLKGRTLSERLKESPLSGREFKQVILGVIDGLNHAGEQGIVHRDIKPSNIFLQESSDGLTAKLLDFGIARLAEPDGNDQKLTATAAVIGSPLYMSPEQCSGKPTNHLTDIYSLGCLMHECLTGKPPFEGQSPMETMYMHLSTPAPRISSIDKENVALAELIQKCLAKNPTERPQCYGELAADLQKAMTGSVGEETITLVPFRVNADLKTKRSRLVPLLAVLVLFAAGAITASLRLNNKPVVAETETLKTPQLPKGVDPTEDIARHKKVLAQAQTQEERDQANHLLFNDYSKLGGVYNNQGRYLEAQKLYDWMYKWAANLNSRKSRQGDCLTWRALMKLKQLELEMGSTKTPKDSANNPAGWQERQKRLKDIDDDLNLALKNYEAMDSRKCHAHSDRCTVRISMGRFKEARLDLQTYMKGHYKEGKLKRITAGELHEKVYDAFNRAAPKSEADKLEMAQLYLDAAEEFIDMECYREAAEQLEWAGAYLDKFANTDPSLTKDLALAQGRLETARKQVSTATQ